MKQNIHPAVVASVIAVLVLIAGVLMWKTATAPSETHPVVVKPANPNDPKFTEHLPKGIAGGGLNGGGGGGTSN